MLSARHISAFLLFELILSFVTNNVVCQEFISVNIPRHLCSGNSFNVSFGNDSSNTIVISSSRSSLGHSETIFLPDGVSCGSMGCSYLSPVTFTDFPSDAVITSTQDIEFVRINIEHSFIADLYINLTCPNSQKAVILRFGGVANTDCASLINDDYRGWLNGLNIERGTFLGAPNDWDDQSNPCNPNVPSNAPGVGWNYCWSNKIGSGYQYPSGDGIIYRQGHTHGNKVDSSNVAAGTNFYHPDQSFSSLIGCPLNGEWYIEVLDGYSSDNGYLFGWELSLSSSLLANSSCVFDSFLVEGSGVTRLNDSSFSISTPFNLTNDTSLLYHFVAFDDCGNVLDTSVWITVHPDWNLLVNDEVVENNLPVSFCGQDFFDDVDDHLCHFTSFFGCDSIIHYSLTVWHNEEHSFDTVVCETALPLQWHGVDFNDADTVVQHLNNIHGADSTIRLVLHTLHQDTIQVVRGICEGSPFLWIDGISYSDTSSHPVIALPSVGPCDSLLRLNLIYPDHPFRADMTVTPNPVQSSNLACTAVDLSQSISREWSIVGRSGDTSRSVSFYYPVDYDSIEVSLLAFDKNGCSDLISTIVYLDKAALWAPNVFTPDEQNNNRFSISSVDIISGEVSVFDRFGRLVVSFDLLEGSWDGTKNGHPCPQGSYVWMVTYVQKSFPHNYKQSLGTVTLLR